MTQPIALQQLPLAVWSQLVAKLVWVYEGPVEPRYRHSYMVNNCGIAWLVLRGRARVTIEHQTASAKAGQWLLPRAGGGRQSFSGDARILSVRFVARWPTGEEVLERSRSLTLDAAAHPELEAAARGLLHLAQRAFPAAQLDLMEMPVALDVFAEMTGALAQWIAAYAAAGQRAGLRVTRVTPLKPAVSRALQLMESHPLRQPFREDDLAGAVGLSTSQLNRLFVQELGRTTRRWMEQRRLDAALHALRESPASVKEMAYALGFSSSPHFCKWFSKQMGQTPSAYRASPPERVLSDR